jgi:hypothetical protein
MARPTLQAKGKEARNLLERALPHLISHGSVQMKDLHAGMLKKDVRRFRQTCKHIVELSRAAYEFLAPLRIPVPQFIFDGRAKELRMELPGRDASSNPLGLRAILQDFAHEEHGVRRQIARGLLKSTTADGQPIVHADGVAYLAYGTTMAFLGEAIHELYDKEYTKLQLVTCNAEISYHFYFFPPRAMADGHMLFDPSGYSLKPKHGGILPLQEYVPFPDTVCIGFSGMNARGEFCADHPDKLGHLNRILLGQAVRRVIIVGESRKLHIQKGYPIVLPTGKKVILCTDGAKPAGFPAHVEFCRIETTT